MHTTAPLALTNAVVSEMMHQGWGRIVNVTTSLGTMLNAGSPTYGPSKAALEALSAIMAKDLHGTGVTVNVLVPGGITNTPMVSEAGFDRTKMIQPEVMVPPLLPEPDLSCRAVPPVASRWFILADRSMVAR